VGKRVLKCQSTGNQVARADNDSVEEQDILLGAIEATKEDDQTREEVPVESVSCCSNGPYILVVRFLVGIMVFSIILFEVIIK